MPAPTPQMIQTKKAPTDKDKVTPPAFLMMVVTSWVWYGE